MYSIHLGTSLNVQFAVIDRCDQPLYRTLISLQRDMLSKAEISDAIEEVRPHLQADGGDVELVEVVDNIVKVKLKGACAGCPMSQMTIKWGIENYLKKKVPGVKAVETV